MKYSPVFCPDHIKAIQHTTSPHFQPVARPCMYEPVTLKRAITWRMKSGFVKLLTTENREKGVKQPKEVSESDFLRDKFK